MGVWKIISGKRSSYKGLKLKEYDHSVGFTLKSDDQFTLEVPNGAPAKPESPSIDFVGVNIPIAYSFSSVGADDRRGADSTVSSLTTNSTDTSTSSHTGTLDEIETDPTKDTIETLEEPHFFISLVMDLCGLGDTHHATNDTDWYPTADGRSSPSQNSQAVVKTRGEIDTSKSLCGIHETPTSETPDSDDFFCVGLPCCANDKYAVQGETAQDRKGLWRQQRAERQRKRRERRQKKKEARAQCNVEVVSAQEPSESIVERAQGMIAAMTNAEEDAKSTGAAAKPRKGLFNSLRKKKS